MKVDHLILTRFCYRDAFKHLKGVGEPFDPLDPDFLRVHSSLLEMVCLPSILSQTDQRFGWIIIVDKDLPAEYRARMEGVAQLRDRTHVIEFRGNDMIGETQWIEGTVLPDTEYLITTMFDDDDSMPVGYVEELRKTICGGGRDVPAAPVKIAAASQIVQWELTFSSGARYGFKCPWHRMHVQASSCGFSLGCKYPELTFSVLGLKHNCAFNYLSFGEPPRFELVGQFRDALVRRCRTSGLALPQQSSVDLSADMSKLVGPVLMTNHSCNTERTRLSEVKEKYEPVSGPGSFREFVIDWCKVEEYADLFQSHVLY